MSKFEKGDAVAWNWGNGKGTGKVTEVFADDVERTIDGTDVKRNASSDSPAYMIEQDDGDRVLKSESELERAE